MDPSPSSQSQGRRPPVQPLTLRQLEQQRQSQMQVQSEPQDSVSRSARGPTSSTAASGRAAGSDQATQPTVRQRSQPRLLPAKASVSGSLANFGNIANSIEAADTNQQSSVMAQIRLNTLILEYQMLQKYAPVNVYLMPADPNPKDIGPKLTYWKGLYFCKQGIYQDSVIRFRLSIPADYPRAMPSCVFQSQVFHPLVDLDTGRLNLEREFSSWQFSKNWLIQVLLYIKKIFHLEKYYSLEGAREQAYNKKAFDLYTSNFEAFVDRCIECVERSIDEKFSDDKTQMQLSDPNKVAMVDEIKTRVEQQADVGSDMRAKEQLKNYFKHNLPDQLRAATSQEDAQATQRANLQQMSVMTAMQSHVMRD